jgi:CheY-like chemotaxis protein
MINVLLVDDDNLVREITLRYLDALGHNVASFDRPSKALDHISSGAAVDLLITDLEMPGGMDGIELAKRVQEQFTQVKVIFVTGSFDRGTPDLANPGSNYEVLTKPFRRILLEEKINQVMGLGGLITGSHSHD